MYTIESLNFPKTILVTDQEIDVSFLSDEQKEFYINFFQELVAYYDSAEKPRVVVGLVGPVGSGKSVIAALCKSFAGQVELPFRFETVGIDAFHYPNDYLLSHKAGDGTLKDVKGRYDTYDVPKLVSTLSDFAAGKAVSLPEYSRKTHDPVEGAKTISEENALLIVEGQWLLYDKNGWEAILPLLDLSYFIEADKEKLRDAVIMRHSRGGRSTEEAAKYYDEVDAQNFESVVSTKNRADRVIPAYFNV